MRLAGRSSEAFSARFLFNVERYVTKRCERTTPSTLCLRDISFHFRWGNEHRDAFSLWALFSTSEDKTASTTERLGARRSRR